MKLIALVVLLNIVGNMGWSDDPKHDPDMAQPFGAKLRLTVDIQKELKQKFESIKSKLVTTQNKFLTDTTVDRAALLRLSRDMRREKISEKDYILDFQECIEQDNGVFTASSPPYYGYYEKVRIKRAYEEQHSWGLIGLPDLFVIREEAGGTGLYNQLDSWDGIFGFSHESRINYPYRKDSSILFGAEEGDVEIYTKNNLAPISNDRFIFTKTYIVKHTNKKGKTKVHHREMICY